MSPTARQSPSTTELLRCVAAKATGKMTLPTVSGTLEAYLMNGDIIGVVHPDDDRLLLRRVRMASALSPERLRQLDKVSAGGQSIFGQLLDEVDGTTIEALLHERFRDNLVAFVAAGDAPSFTAMAGVFIDNMQMGQDTTQLMDVSCQEADLATTVALDASVLLGTGLANDEADSQLLALATEDAQPLDTLLSAAPVELWLGRARAAALIETGALLEDGAELHELGTDEIEMLRDDDDDEQGGPAAAPEGLMRADAPQPADDDEDTGDPDTARDNNVLAEAETATEEEVPEAIEEPLGDVNPEELAKWLDTGSGLSEEDLAFFQDHENDRGAGRGGFSTESHNLDTVHVEHSVEHEVLEADEAPTAKFSAPVLSEADATEKIEVCNDVLRRVCAAFDALDGSGRGRAAIQLLVDGSPSKFTALLHDITVSGDGELPAEDLLDNLGGRPASEHRQLINSALKNVIERALSSAADDLPEESFDDVYESVAGYNQRLGL